MAPSTFGLPSPTTSSHSCKTRRSQNRWSSSPSRIRKLPRCIWRPMMTSFSITSASLVQLDGFMPDPHPIQSSGPSVRRRCRVSGSRSVRRTGPWRRSPIDSAGSASARQHAGTAPARRSAPAYWAGPETRGHSAGLVRVAHRRTEPPI